MRWSLRQTRRGAGRLRESVEASAADRADRHASGLAQLQRMGAVRLRGAGWILPETPETTELFSGSSRRSSRFARATIGSGSIASRP